MDHIELARKGGKAVKKKYGKAYFKKLRKMRKNYPQRKQLTTASRKVSL